jgi:hypothetical protein
MEALSEMKKLDTLEELAKAAGQLAGMFTKNADFHKAAAAHHAGAHAHHESHAAFHKAAHAAMDDGHEMKAHVGKVHEHHVAKAAHHKAMADAHNAAADTAKTMAAAFGAEPEVKKDAPTATAADTTDGIAAMLKTALSSNLDEIAKSPEFKDMVKSFAMDQIREVFGNKVDQTKARKVFGEKDGGDATDRLQLIHRAGGTVTDVEKGAVSAEMEDALAI